MPRLSLAKLVVAFLTRDARTTSLDLLARVSVLEGIAGVNPGAWMRNVVPEKEIVEVFGPRVKANWLSPRDSGLVTAVRRSLEPLLKNTTTTADDILQPAIIGLGASGEVSRLPLFYGVGKAPGFTVEKVAAGSLVPRDVLAVANSYARRRAIDVLRAQARKPGIVRVDGDEVEPIRKHDVIDTIVAVLADPGHPKHGVLRRSLWAVVEREARPSDRRIFEALVGGAHKGMNDAAVARALGISRAAVSQAKKRDGVVIRDAIARNPKLIEPVQHQHELDQLGLARRVRRQGSNTSSASASSRRRHGEPDLGPPPLRPGYFKRSRQYPGSRC
ncbi:hypothetical protein G6O69_28520 [Pseudenhygromyxa sp. WMMC2535]|uniref:hypothetical protein n=1 Tax=Pseudenhygromyxa sp. WMMC2535 TaxID=2712867 RepID=UPI001557CB32|nr:hypothetical protein [Pseudenhygromyxa sp. WMMC2535]NVB41811.1 hypothetical protein [Pseudenhygromyxa sp. WMMC2535]